MGVYGGVWGVYGGIGVQGMGEWGRNEEEGGGRERKEEKEVVLCGCWGT